MARSELVAACTLIGMLGGALFGFAVARGDLDWGLIVVLTISTTFSATLLGLFLARPGARDNIARAGWSTFVAGALNGVLTTIAMVIVNGSPRLEELIVPPFFAAVFGALCALPFAPAIIISTATASWNDLRESSVAARSQGRRVLRNALLCLGSAAACIIPRDEAPLAWHLPAYVMGAAFVATCALFAIDLLVHRGLRAHGNNWEPAPAHTTAEKTIDYGIGLAVEMRRAHGETYREGARAVEVRLGDVDCARELVEGSMRGHALAALTTGTALLLTIASR